MTWLQNRIFGDVIKVKLRSHWIRMGPKSSMNDVLIYKGGNFTMWRWRQKLVMLSQNKEYLGLSGTGRSQKGSSSWGFQGRMALTKPWFWTSNLQNCKRIYFWHFKPSVCCLVTKSHLTLRDWQALVGKIKWDHTFELI